MVSEKAIFPFMECRMSYTGGGGREKDFEKTRGHHRKILWLQQLFIITLMPLN
jgi:hypothetical protein